MQNAIPLCSYRQRQKIKKSSTAGLNADLYTLRNYLPDTQTNEKLQTVNRFLCIRTTTVGSSGYTQYDSK